MMTAHTTRNLFVSFLLLLAANLAQAQCTNVASVESVRNGDFEAGYLTKSGSSHTFTAGGPFDFQSDLTSGATYTGPGTPNCIYSMGNQYGVARSEAANIPPCGNNYPYLGNGYTNVPFTDHTPGKGGAGFAFLADFEAFGGAKYDASGLAAAWRQDVTIIANEKYYFSAWFANYNRDAGTAGYTNPILNFVVIPMVAGVPVWAQRAVLGTATPTGQMNWQQFSGLWTPAASYTEAMLLIEVQQANQVNTNDLAIDDISFINGCQNLASLPAALIPNLGATQSICTSSGTINLNSNVSTGGTTTFFWYNTGAGTTLVSNSAVQNTYSVSAAGSYKVCVQSASFPSGCSASSTVVITNTMPTVNLPDQVICSSPSVTMNAGVSGTSLSYAWTVPAAFTPNPGNVQSFSTAVTGAYNVTVSSSVAGCSPVSDGATVTTNLSSATLNSVVTCAGASKTFNVSASGGAGSSYGWYSAASGGTLLASGATTNVTVASSPSTVYVENYTATAVGPTTASATGNSGGAATYAETSFTALTSNLTIGSIMIKDVAACSGTFTISLDVNGSASGLSTTVPCSGAFQTVTLNWPITTGNTYKLKASGAWFAVNSSYTATSYSGLVNITGAGGGGSGAFVAWQIKQGSPCLRTPVTLDCSLPVAYLYFEAAENANRTVELVWATSTELNSSHFVIERSTDGISFTNIGSVKAQGTSASSQQYSFTDLSPLAGDGYYRLKQVDVDGSFTYSVLREVSLNKTNKVTLYPNPSSGQFFLNYSGASKEYTVEVFDVLGKLLISKKCHEPSSVIDLTGYPKGVYFVQVQNSTTNHVERVVLE